MKAEIFALIPAYEPDSNLPKLTRSLYESGMKVVVVDDGSGEKYAPVFKEILKYATVLTHEKNSGKGRALKTGFSYILKHGFLDNCAVVTLDCDGQHKAKDALFLCSSACKKKNTLFLGSRRFEGNVPWKSRFGNTVTRIVYRLASGQKVYDTQTGLRAFNACHLEWMLSVSGERYEYEMNVLLKCPGANIKIEETDIETVYINENAGSHFNALWDSLKIYGEIMRFLASSLAGFAVDYCLYSLIYHATGMVTLSNVSARAVSSFVNFMINRQLVFKSRTSVFKAAAKYYALAVCILAGNTVVLNLLTRVFSINGYAAKLLTEILFFTVSWTVQKSLIFCSRKNQREEHS